jgi:hypothetical protein
MDLLGLNMPPAILLGADEVIEQDARARKLKLSRSQLGTWTKDSFGSIASFRARRDRGCLTPTTGPALRVHSPPGQLRPYPTSVHTGNRCTVGSALSGGTCRHAAGERYKDASGKRTIQKSI